MGTWGLQWTRSERGLYCLYQGHWILHKLEFQAKYFWISTYMSGEVFNFQHSSTDWTFHMCYFWSTGYIEVWLWCQRKVYMQQPEHHYWLSIGHLPSSSSFCVLITLENKTSWRLNSECWCPRIVQSLPCCSQYCLPASFSNANPVAAH